VHRLIEIAAAFHQPRIGFLRGGGCCCDSHCMLC
jgi:hypothetical protein